MEGVKKKKKVSFLAADLQADWRTFPAKHNHHVVCLLSQTPKEVYVGKVPQEYWTGGTNHIFRYLDARGVNSHRFYQSLD